ncbi:hypothetical protein FW796_28895 [Pseudomonas sp. 910_21]
MIRLCVGTGSPAKGHAAGAADAFAGRPAPTTADTARFPRRSRLAGEEARKPGVALRYAFAGKPAPTGEDPLVMQRLMPLHSMAISTSRKTWPCLTLIPLSLSSVATKPISRV